MRSLLLYILQMTIASGILYAYYYFALRNTKFHRYNRFYILAAMLISILLPFLNIPIYFTADERQSSLVFQTLSVFSASQSNEIILTPSINQVAKNDWFTLKNILYGLYILISCMALVRIIFSFKNIRRIIQANPVEEIQDIHFVNTNEPGTPYSFFRWLFWNRKIELRSEKGEKIFRHELFHIKEKHSRDILFTELITIVFWINPFFHLMKKELKAIHEFLADQFAVNENGHWEYAELLLMQALNTQNHLTHPFFHNQIKRRIAMLTTSTKPGHQYLRKVLVLPVAAIVLALFAFKYKERENSQNHLPPGKTFTVVIDAGHGGSETGTTGSDGTLEKNIVLEIAQKVKSLNTDDNLNILLTRDGDATIPLQNRTAFSNNEHADLFISLHVNTQMPSNATAKKSSGIEVYIPNYNKSFYSENRILASILLNYFSQLYTVNGSIQHRDKKIWVLENTNCPSAMVEVGYMNNNADLHFIEQPDNQDKIAKAILQTIDQYFLQKESDDWEERKKDVIDTISALTQIAQKQGLKTQGAIVIGGKPGNSYSFVSDSIIFKSNSKNPELKDALIILNGKRIAAETISNKTVIAKSLTIYPQNDPQVISKFGADAKRGVLVFEDAKIQEPKVIEVTLVDTLGAKNKKPGTDANSGKANSGNTKTKEDKVIEVTLVDTVGPNKKVFVKTEVEASFPGGDMAWRKYLERTLSDFNPADSGASEGTYTVIAQFIVDKEGSISDIKTLTHFGHGMEQKVIEIIKNGPKWVPAIQNGHKVKAYVKQPVTFVVQDETEVTNQNIINPGKLTKTEIDRLPVIYPNPANNTITVNHNSSSEGKGEIRVYDSKGLLKISSPVNFLKGDNSFSVDISPLTNGIYFVYVIGANKTIGKSYKLIKE